VNVWGLAVSGRYAYMTDSSTGLHVIDLSDPANLRRVGGNGAFAAAAVAIDNGNVYVTAQESGLVILDSYHLVPEIRPILPEDSHFHLSLLAEDGQAVRLQRSTDLRTWQDWRTITGTGSFQPLVDVSASGMPMQFYRAATLAP
jgi:hypothetical protein